MHWVVLPYFLADYREGNFSAAGRVLGVNGTTVTRRLGRREDELGALVFQPSADGLVPTPTAEAIVDEVTAIERKASLIRGRVHGDDARLQGTVSLSVTITFASWFVLRHLHAFRRAHPQIDVDVRTSDAMVDLTRGEADIAVRFRRAGTGAGVDTSRHVEVLAQRVGDFGIAVYASADYVRRNGMPANAFELSQHDVILPPDDSMLLPGAEWFAHARRVSRAAVYVDEVEAMVGACVAGMGITALPTFVVHEELVRIDPANVLETRVGWLLVPADLRRVARVRALRDFLVERIEHHADILSGASGIAHTAD